jgi:hypothetical protein
MMPTADRLADMSAADTAEIVSEFPRSSAGGVESGIYATGLPGLACLPREQRNEILLKAATTLPSESDGLGRLLLRKRSLWPGGLSVPAAPPKYRAKSQYRRRQIEGPRAYRGQSAQWPGSRKKGLINPDSFIMI